LIQKLEEDARTPEEITTSILISYEFIRFGPESLKTVKADQKLPLTISHVRDLADLLKNDTRSKKVEFFRAYNPWVFNRAKGLASITHSSTAQLESTFPNCTLSLEHPFNSEVWYFSCIQEDVTSPGKSNITGPFFYVQSTKM
jgi:hypothetical protein